MKFSTYYRISNRDKFFEKYIKKNLSDVREPYKTILTEKYSELMEIIVKLIMDENKEDLNYILSKNNAKVARSFFDYLTNSKIKKMKKSNIINALDEIFKGENVMKDFQAYLSEKVKPIKLNDEKFQKIMLTEEDDPFADDAGGGDDVGGDDMGGDDMGGDDPFAEGGDSGDTAGGGAGDGEGSEGGDGTDENGEGEGEELPEREDDPDFTKGVSDSEDITITDNPSGKCIYDVEGIMKAIEAVLASLPENELAEFDMVKKAVELIFNGKKLIPEDVTFQNPKNASYLIKKIGEKVDEKTKNYMILKIKQPLIAQRDKQKEEIAAMKNDTSVIRDTISGLDK